MRTCIGCRKIKPKSSLLRLVKKGNEIVFDLKQKMPGRGAYVCNQECFQLAQKKKAFSRAFRISHFTN